MTQTFGFITFLSDYGLADEFVGVCHGVMKKIAPQVEIIDITHGIKPQSVREGAMVLAHTVAYMPPGVHLAIVDPGVGGDRLPLMVATKEGSILVGPDNGLLPLAAERLGGAVGAFKITNPSYMLSKVSKTFQGRDVFAPVAAHLANGVSITEVGEEISVESVIEHEITKPRHHEDHFHATILHVDRFGNVQLNLSPDQLDELGLAVGSMLEVRCEGRRNLVPFGDTFSVVPQGELVVVEDSYGMISVSVNHGSAADRMAATVGSQVIIGPPGSGAD